MEISRRRLLQAFAAAPLATVPTIVFGALDRLPTAREVLTNGANITVTCKWHPDQMYELAAYCAAFTYLDYKTTEDIDALHASFDNYISFMLDNAGPGYTIFGLKAMLTDYRLPLQPKKSATFERFHNEAGNYIVQACDGLSHPERIKYPLDPDLVVEVGQMLKEPGFVTNRLPSLS